MDCISGTVERLTYVNEESGFGVIKIKARGYPDLVTVVGNLASVHIGSSLKIRGEWKTDSKFGKQFSAVDYDETLPATAAGI